MVAATVEEEGHLGASSFTKKRKVGPEPPLQGRSKSTRKDEAIPSSLPVPESADVQDRNPDSGIVLREPLSSGMLPPRRPRGNTSRARSSPSSGLVARASSQSGNPQNPLLLESNRSFKELNIHTNILILDKEKIRNIFRCFHTRFGKKLPSFERWRDEIKKMYISHSFHSSQHHHYYKEELVKVSKRAAVAEEKIENLQSSNQLVKEAADLDSVRREEIERLERSGEETKKNLAEAEQKLKAALADHDFAKGEIELLRSKLNETKSVADELGRKNVSLSKLKDQDVRKISHDARQEVKVVGQKFLLAVQEFISADKAWNKLKFERDEMKSNLDLITEIEEGTINLTKEKETVSAELAETEAKLATVPQPYLDLQQFASEFADSPPLTEHNTGFSLDEMVLTGSPHARFNEFGTNVDKISSSRTQGFAGQDAPISSTIGDDFDLSSEPPQDASLLIPKAVLTTQDATTGGALPVSSQVENEGGSPMNE
ncbi:uncharacterized protein LOC110227156 [Arabidopsis lyrata subsp. lyrata]|uniref:uncharacterized protein LOC110227156 n=1 Tax=Arabidopsis lyrata subsp. lyrata TaxID=81972 RepID=UPI000A29D3AC|nr:uncharacterized protein LOC110227156 [Arabidopsis lyrata subsp. lyrata]|eukprot:XP_020876179.1 uncharacterized protein LOC110227156 [Arabidopsis lyrata subsp. lyrata]